MSNESYETSNESYETSNESYETSNESYERSNESPGTGMGFREGARALAFLGLLIAAAPLQIQAQEESDTVAAQAPAPGSTAGRADSTLPGPTAGPSPAGAFLRGALIPGWGHAASGSLGRGAFYFGVESASVWMLLKTVRKLGAVRSRVEFWEGRVATRLAAEGVTDPAVIAEAVDTDPNVVRTRNLAAGREEQREDWLATTIFFLLVSGVDAFVSAHLKDFPEPLTVETGPGGEGVEVGMRIPVDWFDGR